MLSNLLRPLAGNAGTPIAWVEPDLSTATYDSINSTTPLGNPTSLSFSSDGHRMLIVDGATSGNHSVGSKYMPTAWSLSGAYTSSSSTLTEVTWPQGGCFSENGMYLFVFDTYTKFVHKYKLPSPWDVSSVSHVSVSSSVYVDTSTMFGMQISRDGKKMYMAGLPSPVVYQWSLSTPWDTTTAVYEKTKSFSSESSHITGFVFGRYGDYLYACDNTNDRILKYNLTTPWDVGTAAYTGQNKSVASQDTLPNKINLSISGDKMYVLGVANTRVYQYSV